MVNVNNYLGEQGVTGQMYNSIRSHMAYVLNWRSACNEEDILQRMAPNLRARVLKQVHDDAIKIIPIFKSQPPGFVTAILQHLRPQLYMQGEVVYEASSRSQGVYFVIRGIAEAYVKVPVVGQADETEEKVVAIVPTGRFFGYTRFMAAHLRDDLAIRAFTHLQVYLLSNSSICFILHFHPHLGKTLRLALEEAVFEQASEETEEEDKKAAARKALYG
ncbi:unnamed protein product, partial [Choristocarpus tenellus]